MTIKDIADAIAALRPNEEYTMHQTTVTFLNSNVATLSWEDILNYIETHQE
jgi:hypothetical protein